MTDTAGSPPSLRMDFVSDIVCPWCAIGLASLQQALANLRGQVDAQIHFQPFELNPQLPKEGEAIADHLRRKYGLSDAQLAENQERIRARGAQLGVAFEFVSRSRIYNTFDAHRLLHWAGIEGDQLALKQALLRAYFAEGRNVADHATLIEIVSTVDPRVDRAKAILASDEFAAEVRADEQFWLRSGIRGVPAVIIERKHLISGGQPVEVFEEALRRIALDNGSVIPT
jgi:predicted DsbA family dithiol-disulfide isomerase